ncbi:MAG: hypothetical protein ACRCUM_01300 [Mycoplasmoidaceae bacterium]
MKKSETTKKERQDDSMSNNKVDFFEYIKSNEFKEIVENDYKGEVFDAISDELNNYFVYGDDINDEILENLEKNDDAFLELIEQAQETYSKTHEKELQQKRKTGQ